MKDSWSVYSKDKNKNFLDNDIKFKKAHMILKFSLIIGTDEEMMNKVAGRLFSAQEKLGLSGSDHMRMQKAVKALT